MLELNEDQKPRFDWVPTQALVDQTEVTRNGAAGPGIIVRLPLKSFGARPLFHVTRTSASLIGMST